MSTENCKDSDKTVRFIKSVLPDRPKEYVKIPEHIKTFPEKIIYIGQLEEEGKLSRWDSYFNMQVLCAEEVKCDSMNVGGKESVCKSSKEYVCKSERKD